MCTSDIPPTDTARACGKIRTVQPTYRKIYTHSVVYLKKKVKKVKKEKLKTVVLSPVSN